MAFLFGGVFFAAGISIMLIGLKVLPVDSKTVHAPYWVLTAAGSVFALAGTMVWNLGLRQHLANQRAREAARQHPDGFALQDYNWNPNGFTPPHWKPALQSIGGSLVFALFLSMFNWWAFFANGPLPVKIIVGLFDLIFLAGTYFTALRVGRAFKFGGSQIRFVQFPCPLSGFVELRWKPAAGIVRAHQGKFILRCVEEYWVTTGSGKNRSRRLVHDELWGGTHFLVEPHLFSRGEEVELRFDLSDNLPSTHLSAERPIFWELEVKLDLPGLDFHERYLVPVYQMTKPTVETL